MPLRIVFMDVDGVMAGAHWINNAVVGDLKGNEAYFKNPFDPTIMAHLNAIVSATDAKIVVSSTWRLHTELSHLQRLMHDSGFVAPRSVIDCTPHLPNDYIRVPPKKYVRGDEIQLWLERQKTIEPVKSFCILDDDADMGSLLPFLVQTDGRIGLEQKHIQVCLNLLGSD